MRIKLHVFIECVREKDVENRAFSMFYVYVSSLETAVRVFLPMTIRRPDWLKVETHS